MQIKNIFQSLPVKLDQEVFELLANNQNVKIERITSKGHSSPETGWYDQTDNEWVIVLQGEAKIEFEHRGEIKLAPGDYLNIPAHTKHRVSWTTADTETIWLAVHYQ